MTQKEKLIERFKSKPKDFTWNELEKMLGSLGYEQVDSGKTGGSRRRFVHVSKAAVLLHKPHPHNILKAYQINQVYDILTQEDLL